MAINLFQDRDTTQDDLLNMLGGTSNPAQSNSQAQSNANVPDYSRINEFYGNQSPLGVYNLLRFGAERGNLEDVSPFSMGDISNWATSSGVLTPYQLEMAQQGKSVSNEDALMNLVRSVSPPPQPPKVTTAPVQPITNYTAQQEFLPQKPLGGIQGQLPGSDFTVEDYYRVMGEKPPAQTMAGMQSSTLSPEQFKQYIYSGGADDAEATRRGIDWVTQQGMRPQDAVNLWNNALGTRFTVTDLFGQTGGGPEFTNFGDADSWMTGTHAEHDRSTGMIKSSGAYFQRGNEAVVSDELFWNPGSPTGEALQNKIADAQAAGQRAGVVITPYAVFQGKATNDQLLNEVKNSGADFVALDPYLGWGVPADQLFDWTKDFIKEVNALGKEVKLVTQGFARKGEEDAARAYNQRLLGLPGVSEVVNFGLEDWFPEGSEDAKQLFSPESEWVSLGNDYKQPERRTVRGTGTTVGEPGATKESEGRQNIGRVENRASAYANRMRQGIGGLRG